MTIRTLAQSLTALCSLFIFSQVSVAAEYRTLTETRSGTLVVDGEVLNLEIRVYEFINKTAFPQGTEIELAAGDFQGGGSPQSGFYVSSLSKVPKKLTDRAITGP